MSTISYTLDKKHSILVMLLKNAEFIEAVKIFRREEDEQSMYIADYDSLMQHYTKYYNSIEYVPYKDIEALYVSMLGDLLFEIEPRLFKMAVYESQGVTGFSRNPLLMELIHKIRMLPMTNINLDVGIKEVLKGKFI